MKMKCRTGFSLVCALVAVLSLAWIDSGQAQADYTNTINASVTDLWGTASEWGGRVHQRGVVGLRDRLELHRFAQRDPGLRPSGLDLLHVL
ncbi:MAG TPA: hypothetical protein PLU30_13225 [Verrucomicrobiae bacterium]|nr:hypothetical protein [Verrucomicrobiae bacterium]